MFIFTIDIHIIVRKASKYFFQILHKSLYAYTPIPRDDIENLKSSLSNITKHAPEYQYLIITLHYILGRV